MNNNLERYKRINQFQDFKSNAKDIFQTLYNNDENIKHITSLVVAPGGRSDGIDPKFLEVFFSQRIISKTKQLTASSIRPVTKINFEYGATLSYFQIDNGHIICRLQPAKTSEMRPLENMIFFDYIKNPALLPKKSEEHWKKLLAYMEVTSLYGNPSKWQIFQVWRLRVFNKYLSDGIEYNSKNFNFWMTISKFIFSVGLSGILIFVISLYFNFLDSEANEEKYYELNSTLHESNLNMKTIIKKLDKMNQITASNREVFKNEIQKLDEINTNIEINNENGQSIYSILKDTKLKINSIEQHLIPETQNQESKE